MITTAAITVNTIVADVPMLNAAPLLRSRSRVRKPPSSRIGAWWASSWTTTILVTTSRASTNTATPMTTGSLRPRTGSVGSEASVGPEASGVSGAAAEPGGTVGSDPLPTVALRAACT
jgi:hypothetical protein